MADLSNRALALLLVVAIVTTIAGMTVMLSRLDAGMLGTPSGFVLLNDSGTTTFTITSNFSITFSNSNLPFGTGTVVGGSSCELGTNATPPSTDANCNGFNDTLDTRNLTVENDGNIRANVSLNFSHNATGLIQGTSSTPLLQYLVYQHEPASCVNIQNGSTFTEVSIATEEQTMDGARVCTNLNFSDSSDTFGIAIWLSIPENAPTGARTLSIYALGCDDGSC